MPRVVAYYVSVSTFAVSFPVSRDFDVIYIESKSVVDIVWNQFID